MLPVSFSHPPAWVDSRARAVVKLAVDSHAPGSTLLSLPPCHPSSRFRCLAAHAFPTLPLPPPFPRSLPPPPLPPPSSPSLPPYFPPLPLSLQTPFFLRAAVKAAVDSHARVLAGERWVRTYGNFRVAREVNIGQTPSAAPEGPVVAAASAARQSIGLLGIKSFFEDAADATSGNGAADSASAVNGAAATAGPFVAAGNDASVANALANGATDSSSGASSSSSSAATAGPFVAVGNDASVAKALENGGTDSNSGTSSSSSSASSAAAAGPFVAAAGNDASVASVLESGATDSNSGLSAPSLSSSSSQSSSSSSSPESAPVFKAKGWMLPHAQQPSDLAPKSIAFHGGAVLSDPITVYLIWHGTWTDERKAPVRAFIQSLADAGAGSAGGSAGGSSEAGSVREWWNVNRLYHSGREHVTGSIVLGTPEVEIEAASSGEGQPPASKNEVNAIINYQLRSRTLPRHDSAIYAVFTSDDVDMAGFGSSFCAFHDVSTVHFTWTGLPSRFIPQCTHAAAPGNTYPHGDRALAGLISNFAHVLAAAAANPNLLSWFDKEGREAMGLCGNNWGTVHTSRDPLPVEYNAVGKGGERFLLPTNLNPVTGSCVNGLSVLPGQCGPKFFGFPCDTVTATEAGTEPPAEAAAAGSDGLGSGAGSGLGAAAASVVGGEAEKAVVGGEGDARKVKDPRVAEAEAAGLDLSVGGKNVGRFLEPGQFDPAKGDRDEDDGSKGQGGESAVDSGAGSNVFESTGYADKGGEEERRGEGGDVYGGTKGGDPFAVERTGEEGLGADEEVGASEKVGAGAGAGAEDKSEGKGEGDTDGDDVFQSTGYPPDSSADEEEESKPKAGGGGGGSAGAEGKAQPGEVNPFVHHSNLDENPAAAAALAGGGTGDDGGNSEGGTGEGSTGDDGGSGVGADTEETSESGDGDVFERLGYSEGGEQGEGSEKGEEGEEGSEGKGGESEEGGEEGGSGDGSNVFENTGYPDSDDAHGASSASAATNDAHPSALFPGGSNTPMNVFDDLGDGGSEEVGADGAGESSGESSSGSASGGSSGGGGVSGAGGLVSGGFQAGLSAGFEFDLSQFKLGERESPSAPHLFPDAAAAAAVGSKGEVQQQQQQQQQQPQQPEQPQQEEREKWVFSGV
ncbi:unnamed protein product [Closterium sp. Naga37s-1]|nr:unnamed protein product [Closterium sp. Naga37s-1]